MTRVYFRKSNTAFASIAFLNFSLSSLLVEVILVLLEFLVLPKKKNNILHFWGAVTCIALSMCIGSIILKEILNLNVKKNTVNVSSIQELYSINKNKHLM